jgi:hypothetical protein
MIMDPSVPDLAVLLLVAVAMLAPFATPRIRAKVESGVRAEEEYTGIGWSSPLWRLSLISNFSPYRLALYDSFLVVATLSPRVVRYADIAILDVRRVGRISIVLKSGEAVTLFFPRDRRRIAEVFSDKNVEIVG